MRPISDTIARVMKLGAEHAEPGIRDAHLEFLNEFGSNPGNLTARTYVPDGLADGAPLVVVLHGCSQSAAGYDLGAGWSTTAERHGFALLFPEQKRANNANLCFNWFEPGDIRRGEGEALSIGQMIHRFCEDRRLDRTRVYITGLSAGGAMTAVMLATYPELFAGGAIIAGLPFGSASGVPQAFDRMRGHGSPDDAALQALVERASFHDGARPPISIWHGTADTTVSVSNVDRLVGQWRGLLDVGVTPDNVDTYPGHRRQVWTRPDGSIGLETVLVSGMGHGTPIDARGPDGCGVPGPFMLDVGLSSTSSLIGSWGLALPDARPATVLQAAARDKATGVFDHRMIDRPAASSSSVGTIIENALKAAGLMR